MIAMLMLLTTMMVTMMVRTMMMMMLMMMPRSPICNKRPFPIVRMSCQATHCERPWQFPRVVGQILHREFPRKRLAAFCQKPCADIVPSLVRFVDVSQGKKETTVFHDTKSVKSSAPAFGINVPMQSSGSRRQIRNHCGTRNKELWPNHFFNYQCYKKLSLFYTFNL